MQRVFKYRFDTVWEIIRVPRGVITHFGEDPAGEICVWIAFDENEVYSDHLYIAGTGQDFPSNDLAIASMKQGNFMWHLIRKDKA